MSTVAVIEHLNDLVGTLVLRIEDLSHTSNNISINAKTLLDKTNQAAI